MCAPPVGPRSGDPLARPGLINWLQAQTQTSTWRVLAELMLADERVVQKWSTKVASVCNNSSSAPSIAG